jgi:ubiquinone/menaquinone biosynthesis C-methylase UbiE
MPFIPARAQTEHPLHRVGSVSKMFSIQHLHTLRAHELNAVVAELTPGAAVLELGAGTGAQALALARRGFMVTAIDLPESTYSDERVFDVIDYDGTQIPCPTASVDVVYSSNVLEHVRDLSGLQQEIKRVLRPGGYCVHILPTTAWRFWTSLAAFHDPWVRAGKRFPELFPQAIRRGEPSRIRYVWAEIKRDLTLPFDIQPHGEGGNAITELWTFSRRHWVRRFRSHGFVIEKAEPMGLFYTGYMIRGPQWGIAQRQRLASWLGSACALYRLSPLELQTRRHDEVP